RRTVRLADAVEKRSELFVGKSDERGTARRRESLRDTGAWRAAEKLRAPRQQIARAQMRGGRSEPRQKRPSFLGRKRPAQSVIRPRTTGRFHFDALQLHRVDQNL